jgi:hypothetical protein
MKRAALAAAVAVLATFALVAAAPAGEPPPPAATDAAVAPDAAPVPVTLDDLFAATAEPAVAGDATEDAAELAGGIIPPPKPWCPYGAPSCNDHDDCDAYCGDPRFGWCFFDTGCCGCSG